MSRSTVSFLSALLIVGGLVTAASADTPACGDVNGNGVINSSDATEVMSFVQGNPPDPFYEEAADVNCDGAIDNTDVNLIWMFAYNPSGNPLSCCEAPESPYAYEGLQPFDQWDYSGIVFPEDDLHAYTGPHVTLYMHRYVALDPHVTRLLDNIEACYDIQATLNGSEWTDRIEYQQGLGISSKTLAYPAAMAPGIAGLGNHHRVEIADMPPDDALGTRDRNRIIYFEMQRGNDYSWNPYLFYRFGEDHVYYREDPGGNLVWEGADYNNAWAHASKVTCQALIHDNGEDWLIDSFMDTLVEWENDTESYLDVLESLDGQYSSKVYPIEAAFTAMLVEMFSIYGIEYMPALVAELLSGDYGVADSGHVQACNFVVASDVVTGGDSYDLLVNEWRFPSDCYGSSGGEVALEAALGDITDYGWWWQAYSCADVTVTNTGDAPSASWEVLVDMIDSTFNGQSQGAIVSIDGDDLIASSTSANGAIAPGGEVTFNFCFTKDTWWGWEPPEIVEVTGQ